MDTIITNSGLRIEENSFANIMSKVFLWMCIGLAITGGVAYYIANYFDITVIFGNPMILWGSVILEFVLVIAISALATKINSGISLFLFFLYSVVNGVTLSFIFLMYLESSIASVFFITAGTFLAMAFYGFFTKRSLRGIGHYAIMGLFGIVIAGIVNLFFMNDTLSFIISAIGVVVFIALTAYDTQKIKNRLMDARGEEDFNRISVYGALILYLDFINLFLKLLRILGKKR